MQIYTDWIDDWINCRINNLENVFICFQSPVNIIQTKVSKPRIKLCEHLLNFWDYDNSEFIKRYLTHGNNMTKKHTKNMISLVKNYWQPYFGDDVFVDELDKPTLDDFFFFLYCEKGLKGGTVNKAINVVSRAMGYLFENGKIEKNPMFGVEKTSKYNLDRRLLKKSEICFLEFDEPPELLNF